MLARGWVLPVLSFMLDRAATADVALHMHFVDKVLRGPTCRVCRTQSLTPR